MNGNKVNLFTSPIIPFALIISLNEIIYIVSFFVKERKNEHQSYAYLHKKNFFRLIRPCLINTITTLIGFLSLSQNPSPSIRLFSLYTSLACFFAYIVTFGLVFAFFRVYQPCFSLRETGYEKFRWFRRLVRNIVFRHAKAVLLVTVVAALLILPALSRFTTRNALTDSFAAADPLVEAHSFISREFCGPYHFQVMVSGPDLMNPEKLAAIAGFQRRIEKISGINRVFSVIDLMLAFNRQFTGEAVLPATSGLAYGIIDFFAQRGISDLLMSTDFSTTLLRVHTSFTDDFKIEPLREKIMAVAGELEAHGLETGVTGDVYLNATMQKNILKNITWSFAAAVIMIVAVFYLVFRSLSVAVIALLVNFFPILSAYALASFLGLPLNPSTAVVGCVMSGLIVDDTLHLLTFLQENKQPTTIRKVMAANRELTMAVSSSSFLLMVGNAIFILSSFKPFTYFGLIGTLVVLIGLAGDLIVLPVLVLASGQKKRAAGLIEPAARQE
jgi:predicted RND superfamily exporter protein